MNKQMVIISLLALVATKATAADMPLKAPRLPPPPVYSWSGFYVGGNIGYSWGRSNSDWNAFAPTNEGNTECSPTDLIAFCQAIRDSLKLNGMIGGLQAGYNWQTSIYLLGIETDFQWSGQKGSAFFARNFPFNAGPPEGILPGTVSVTHTEKLTWLGTLRGRLGITVDRWVVFATGGLAYGRVRVDGSAFATGNHLIFGGPPCAGANEDSIGQCPLAAWSNQVTKVGWALGIGGEGAITNYLSWKVEYLHIDLGTIATTFATAENCYGVGTPGGLACSHIAAGGGSISSRITDNIVRVGLNYKFGN
jgi:outer membrane immunogenic protein